jgi:anti-sigma B factor antagonist
MNTFQKDECILFQPLGILDHKNGSVLQNQIAAMDSSQNGTWIVDLAHVELIDSAGLVALVSSLNLASQQRCRFVLHNPPQVVNLVLEITRLDRVFEIVHSGAETHEQTLSLFSGASSKVLAAA